MPDGDIVHPTISARYNNLYKQVDEGAGGEEDWAREAIRCLKKDLIEYGEAPIQLIEQATALFEGIESKLPQNIAIDWAQERRDIKDLAQQVLGSKRAIQLAVKACEQQLHTLRQEKDYAAPCDFFREISKRYMLNVYDAQFASQAYRNPPRESSSDLNTIRSRLEKMRPLVIQYIARFSDSLVKHGNIQKIRLPRRIGTLRKIDLETDLDSDLSELVG